jgi:hypothetical protein
MALMTRSKIYQNDHYTLSLHFPYGREYLELLIRQCIRMKIMSPKAISNRLFLAISIYTIAE